MKKDCNPNWVDNKNYIFWITKIYNYFPISDFFISLLIGLLVFLIGLFIAYIYEFQTYYINTKLIYVGIFGIMWVSYCLVWGDRNLINNLIEIRPNFAVSDCEFAKSSEKWLNLMYNHKKIAFFCTMFIIFTYFSVLVTYKYHINETMIFPDYWYAQPTFYKILILDIYGTVIASLIVASAIPLICSIFLMKDIGKKRIIFCPNITVDKFKPICNFYAKMASTWLLGIPLFLFAFYHENEISLLIFISISIPGIWCFFIPHISFNHSIKKSKRELLKKMDIIYRNQCYIVGNASYDNEDLASNLLRLHELDKIYQNLARSRTRVYDYVNVLKMIGYYLFPFLLFILDKISIEDVLKIISVLYVKVTSDTYITNQFAKITSIIYFFKRI